MPNVLQDRKVKRTCKNARNVQQERNLVKFEFARIAKMPNVPCTKVESKGAE